MNSNPDMRESTNMLGDNLAGELVTEAGEPAGRVESGCDSSSDDTSSDGSSDCSSDSGGGSRRSSTTESNDAGPPSMKPRQRSEAQDPFGMQPTQLCEYATQVQSWTKRIPIGLGLCPWAGKSQSQGRLRYMTCECDTPSDVAQLILTEATRLTQSDVAPLSSTLVVCPYVAAWKDFAAFDTWVASGINEELKGESLDDKVTLVSFHPGFLRWRGLPEGVEVGSVVQSYWGTAGRKSLHTSPATVIDTSNSVFGMQKIQVRFHESMEEQFVPIDWFAQSVSSVGPPLPDNAMHRAPHPTIHLIRNDDLGTLCMRDVSRVKRKNAQRMMKLGWEGVEMQLRDT